MQISVVIPLLNEEDSLIELFEWIDSVMQAHNFSYEVIFIDDGSTDDSWEIIKNLVEKNPELKGIRFQTNYGKSQALHAGFAKAEGDVIITMDADLQDSPDEIPELYQMIVENDYDLVSGWKKKRYDSKLSKNIPSKLFNFAARKTSGLKLHDFNCGLKAYKKEVVKSIEVTGEMHRYIPVLVKSAGFKRIAEKPVRHQARKYGKTKFGAGRFIKGFLDLLSIFFVGKFGKRPMHFFGTIGVMSFLIGFFIACYLIFEKLMSISKGAPYRNVTDQPLFFLALTAIIIGSQLFLTGFLAELISRNSAERNKYQIDRVI